MNISILNSVSLSNHLFLAADAVFLHFEHLRIHGIIFLSFYVMQQTFPFCKISNLFLLSLGIKPLSCCNLIFHWKPFFVHFAVSHFSYWLSCNFYFLGVGYPATDLSSSSSGIGLSVFLVNYHDSIDFQTFFTIIWLEICCYGCVCSAN
jgi:hypothetical protein